MKHKILLFIILLLTIIINIPLNNIIIAQTILRPDTCIDMKYYISYCIKRNDTLLVSYCYYNTNNNNYKRNISYSRKGMNFYGNTKHFNYLHSGYDKGHLVPAEDLSYNRTALESTFRWWNCVPQRVYLNRGIWKSQEVKIHKLIKTRNKLNIIVGATDYNNGIPKYCFKAVYDEHWKQILLFIYDQNGNNIKVPNEFKMQLNDILNKLKK